MKTALIPSVRHMGLNHGERGTRAHQVPTEFGAGDAGANCALKFSKNTAQNSSKNPIFLQKGATSRPQSSLLDPHLHSTEFQSDFRL